MRRILIVCSRLGMTGCQLIRLQEASIILNVAALDLLDAVQKIKSDVTEEALNIEEMQKLISEAKSPFRTIIKKKKPK